MPGTATIAARWPRYQLSYSAMREASVSPLSLVKIIVSALAQEEFAPGLDHRFPVIGDDVGGRVGLAPDFGQVGAGADDIDRRVGDRHHPAFLRAKAGARDDPRAGKVGLVERHA